MQAALGYKHSTRIYNWKYRGTISDQGKRDIYRAAQERGYKLSAEQLLLSA